MKVTMLKMFLEVREFIFLLESSDILLTSILMTKAHAPI